MTFQIWSQDNFSKGELTPFMYARAQVNQYFNGMKTAQNVLTYPMGAAGKRFGTLFQDFIDIDSSDELFFLTFQWLDNCVFQIAITPGFNLIYLEGILIKSVVNVYDTQTISTINYTTIADKLRVTSNIKPYDLQLSADADNVITGVSSNTFTLTTAVTNGLVLPVKFSNTGGMLPTTTPQIKAGVTYFLKYLSTSTAAIYATAYNAKFDIDRFTLTNAGTGTNNLIQFNNWTFTNPTFKNLPIYDFDGGYDTITFTPSAVSGAAVTLTASSPIFGTALANKFGGGAFIGGGGTARILSTTDSTHVTIAVQESFDNTNPILGLLSFLGEPAWSDARGWPKVCSSYQNRALFANTVSLSNGLWGSVINEYNNFGDLTNDDDDAISWFPSSNEVNVIRFIVPYRSLTIHTNTGVYSTPLAETLPITPSTFTLQLQESTPADVLLPQAIDNQIVIVTGNDVHNMVWEGINNAYTNNIISVVNEQLIREPVDETAYYDFARAGSRYVFIINANGSMAVYQTLIAEQINGFTGHIMEQSYGHAKFLQVASSVDGRAWFAVQREIAEAGSTIAITITTPPTTIVGAVASNFDTAIPTAVLFSTTGSLPTSTPQINTTEYFWVIGIDADTFRVYTSQADALADENAIIFSTAGSLSSVTGWPLSTVFTLEELSQDVKLDCAVYYNSTPTDTVNTGTLFNAQDVKMVGDDFGFEATGINNEVVFEAHGSPVDVSKAFIGFPINLVIEPMPIAYPPGPNTQLTRPTHIRSVRFMFNNTIGGEINGVPIALKPFNMADIGQPPLPARGVFEMMIMKGWDDINNPSFTITHDEPFDIQLIGIFYSIDN